jgi:hypothetical protein
LLTLSEIEQFRSDGYLFIDRPVLATAAVLKACQLADDLFASWQKIPRRLAPDVAGDAPVLGVKYAMSLAPTLRRSGVFKDRSKLARELLGAKRVWCHFDHIIYKHPGADRVD